jgi:hypothetical protein
MGRVLFEYVDEGGEGLGGGPEYGAGGVAAFGEMEGSGLAGYMYAGLAFAAVGRLLPGRGGHVYLSEVQDDAVDEGS